METLSAGLLRTLTSFPRAFNGLYPIVHRTFDHSWNIGIYAGGESADYGGSGSGNASFSVCGKLYCQENLCNVSASVQDPGELTSLIDEMIGNQKVVQAFGYEDEAQMRFEEINERLRSCSLRAMFFSSITNPSTRFVNSMVYASVGVVGAYAAIRGLLSVGQLSIF